MDAGGEAEVFGIARVDEAMAQAEIDQHEIDVELEIVADQRPLMTRLRHWPATAKVPLAGSPVIYLFFRH